VACLLALRMPSAGEECLVVVGVGAVGQ